MDKQKMIKVPLLVFLGIIVFFIIAGIICFLVFFHSLQGPKVNKDEKKEVMAYTEAYLTKKYGNHYFKAFRVEYDYDMERLFDYSNPTGYSVYYKCDGLKDFSSATIKGFDLNNAEISEHFLVDYLYSDLDSYEKFKEFYETKPNVDVEKKLLNELEKALDVDIKTLEINRFYIELPDDYGKLPTMEEIKNDLELFKANTIYFTLDQVPSSPDGFQKTLNDYLIKTFGGEWTIVGAATDRITCERDTAFSLSIFNEK